MQKRLTEILFHNFYIEGNKMYSIYNDFYEYEPMHISHLRGNSSKINVKNN